MAFRSHFKHPGGFDQVIEVILGHLGLRLVVIVVAVFLVAVFLALTFGFFLFPRFDQIDGLINDFMKGKVK